MRIDRRALLVNRQQLEALYGAPVETIVDQAAGKTAFLPG